MQPNRILPDLQSSLVCQDVRQEANGNLILIGIMQFIPVPETPVTAAQLLVFNRWCAGVGQFTDTVRIVAPDSSTVVAKSDLKFVLQHPHSCATNVNVIRNLEFKVPGVYFVEVLVDDVLKLRYPLPVAIPQKQAPPGAQPPAAGTPPGQ
ncbi:MAG TPA: hypothetical protein DCM86_09310 [Verrucomicrobiales bacterium]|nr:hypothetical protein [Verrucomicrobiales bacterium]